MSNALVSVQIIPKTPNGEDTIPYVDAAIEVIQQSGVKHVVQPLDTVMEGDLEQLLRIVQQMHEKMAALGATSTIGQVKIFHKADGASMDVLTEKYR
ncbi:MAG TPA: MTH1187 family thiamine-binding protein [Savagea sp.]